jgi:FKBP-type peptidyl-prolyl cis-trans isomerase 2
MKKGDLVVVSFTGKEKASGKVFDTTEEKTAKEAGIFQEQGVYKAIPVIVGKGELLKGLDEALQEMKAGEKKTVELSPEKAFGERKGELVGLVPLQEFKKKKLQPVPGMFVNINDRVGKVQSVSGGRVRVDFNHELAGKSLEYDLFAERVLEKAEEKVEALAHKYLPFVEKPKVKFVEKDGLVEIIVPGEFAQQAAQVKLGLTKALLDFVDEVKKVRLVEEFDAASFTPKK